MSENRWQQVEEFFHRAAELPPEARSAFLDQVCGVDHSLRHEVASLLAHASEEGITFSGPAKDNVPRTIAHYEISGKLGEGGMGAVYQATDTKLGREVAIKFLPPSFADDADRMARLNREARVLASLNHPHIAQIYGVEERALVMELVPGKTLKRPLPLDTALNCARQITEALEAAHEKGIVHRDLKPANIMVTAEGEVKLLDFGLAAFAPSAANPLDSPPITLRAAKAGMIMGTAAYMSPEQAAGKPVDKRADVWSFGVVLWELLSGRRLFEGETVSQTLAEVLGGPIDFDQLPPQTPPAIRGLLRRCLDRNVKNRLRDIGEARIVIESALAGETPHLESTPQPGGARNPWLAWSVAAVLAVGLATVTFLHFREKAPASPASLRFPISAPANTARSLCLSPDGRKLAFIAGQRLWVHSLESGEARDLGAHTPGPPFWSPDSRFVGFNSKRQLMKIDATGGPARVVTELSNLAWGGAAWNPDGVIVFSDSRTGLFRVPASGGVPVQITAIDRGRQEFWHLRPSFLPDGRHFVYARATTDATRSGIYLGSIDAEPGQQPSTRLGPSQSQAQYVPSPDPNTGHLLFVLAGTLLAQPFDNRRFELKGRAAPVVEQIGYDTSSVVDVPFSASANGVLAFAQTTPFQLTWYDREGKTMGTVSEAGFPTGSALSQNGTQLAVTQEQRSGANNIWLLDPTGGSAGTPFTFGPFSDAGPVWSPDGSRIIFSSNRDGPIMNLYQKPLHGGKEEILLKSGENKYAGSWSRNGQYLLYRVDHAKTMSDLWVLPLQGDRKPVLFLATEFREMKARFSPDGRWVAYSSDKSGMFEIYVRPFSMDSTGTAFEAGQEFRISNGFGNDPHWRGDGRELYYRSISGQVMSVEVVTNPSFRAGSPRPLGVIANTLAWDSTPDGKRFVVPTAQDVAQPYTVLLNWQAGLKQ